MTNTRIVRTSRRAFTRGLPLLVAAALAASACDILDVENPNNLLEEQLREPESASAAVGGALSTVARAISRGWQPIGITADELIWIGSRDAWGQLDFGFLFDPSNEFADENFPYLAEARWMADEAESLLMGHVQESPTSSLQTSLAKTHLYSGLIYMVLGETQEDFAFSDKMEPGEPVGAENMYTVLDQAIEKLSSALALAEELEDSELATRALALRARARHSRAIWDKIKPTVNTGDPLVSASGAVADAQEVISRVGDDWTYQLSYSAETITNNMAGWINSRGENQFDSLVVNLDEENVRRIVSVRLEDPVDDVADPVITAKLTEWKSPGEITGTGTQYPPLTLTSARHMHLILAEDALQRGDDAGFATHINHVRSMDGLTEYSGQIPAMDMLEYERRVNLFLMGLRLNDMYRFGTQDVHWQASSDAVRCPGTLMPISTVELRANPLVSERRCGN